MANTGWRKIYKNKHLSILFFPKSSCEVIVVCSSFSVHYFFISLQCRIAFYRKVSTILFGLKCLKYCINFLSRQYLNQLQFRYIFVNNKKYIDFADKLIISNIFIYLSNKLYPLPRMTWSWSKIQLDLTDSNLIFKKYYYVGFLSWLTIVDKWSSKWLCVTIFYQF